MLLGVNPTELPNTVGSGIFRARSHLNARGSWKNPAVTYTNTIVPKTTSSQTIDIPQVSRTSSPDNHIKHTRETPWRETEKKSPRQKERQTEYTDTVLKVDKNCLNCSGNMTQTIRGIKTACLAYTAGLIPYRDQEYHVDDILDVKATVIAKC